MRGDGTPAREATEALAAEGKHERGAAESEPDYVHALPERYRRKWERSGIGERVQEVTRQTRTSLKARLSFTPEKHVEAAVRKECGGEAQRLDREMREEMQQDRRLWDVLIRMDTLQYEESRAADERVAGESLERAITGVPQSEQGRSWSSPRVSRRSPNRYWPASHRTSQCRERRQPPLTRSTRRRRRRKKSAAGSRWIVDPAPTAGCGKRFSSWWAK